MTTWDYRRTFLMSAAAVLVVGLTGQLIYMQLIRAGHYRRIANENRIRVVRLAAPRGRIVDRNNVELVRNRPAFSIAVVPADFRGETPRLQLARALDMTVPDLATRLTRRRTLPLEPVPIRRDVDLRTIGRIEERIEEFSGVVISTDPVRKYPELTWAGHLFGYVREVSDEDSRRSDKAGAPLRGMVGATGLERTYDDVLRGVDGISYRQMNAFGQMMGAMPGYDDVPPIPGDDLMLSVDARLQQLADSLLSNFTAGTVVAIDVRTGGILCYVTRPGFDPNSFIRGMTNSEWVELRDSPLHPLLNRASMGLYPPGSTTKLITAAAALEGGLITPNQRLSACTGAYRFGNRTFHCWNLGGHGSLDLEGAIEQSCDVYFYQVGQKLNLDEFGRHIRQCGFGKPAGLDLPTEEDGIVPTRDLLNRLYGRQGWSRGVMLNLSIGQGELTVTPLQLAVFYAAIANNGTAIKPHLVKARRSAGGPWVEERSRPAFNLPWSERTLGIIREACRKVVIGERGTAKNIRDTRIRMAGKTGTAQNPHGNEHAWFAAWAPYEDPQIAVVALVENVGHGSTFAAPICYEIARAYLSVPALPDSLAPVVPSGPISLFPSGD